MEKMNRYNTLVINRIKIKYGVSRRFITQSLKGDRKSETSESIVKDYKKFSESIDKALKS